MGLMIIRLLSLYNYDSFLMDKYFDKVNASYLSSKDISLDSTDRTIF